MEVLPVIKCVDLDACRDDFYAKVLDILSADFSNDRANQIIDEFDSLPTIEAEPIKYGKWEGDATRPTKRWHCSECGNLTETAHYCYECYYLLCPYCGAKMNGGKENEST